MLLLQVIVGGLLLGAIYALFSSGLTLIWGMMNFINFAHGEFVMLGPMLAQILSTFGLALLMRYTAFWIFSANVVSLPQTSLGGTLNIFGIFVPAAQLVAGVTPAALPPALHMFLTHTTMGSKLLA